MSQAPYSTVSQLLQLTNYTSTLASPDEVTITYDTVIKSSQYRANICATVKDYAAHRQRRPRSGLNLRRVLAPIWTPWISRLSGRKTSVEHGSISRSVTPPTQNNVHGRTTHQADVGDAGDTCTRSLNHQARIRSGRANFHAGAKVLSCCCPRAKSRALTSPNSDFALGLDATSALTKPSLPF
jgi:hypothetical protein